MCRHAVRAAAVAALLLTSGCLSCAAQDSEKVEQAGENSAEAYAGQWASPVVTAGEFRASELAAMAAGEATGPLSRSRAWLLRALQPLFGVGASPDPKAAFDLMSECAAEGISECQSWLATMYEFGLGTSPDGAAAMLLHTAAHDGGYVPSALALGTRFAQGHGTHCEAAQHFVGAGREALRLAEAVPQEAEFDMLGAEGGRGPGLAPRHTMGERGVKNDRARLTEVLAEAGNADALTSMGYHYLFGLEGFPMDYAVAERNLRLAADQGHAQAQYLLGTVHAKGLGVPQDTVRARNLLEAAIARGHPAAPAHLGYLWTEGFPDQPANRTLACEYFQVGAERGDVKAMGNLAVCYRNGWMGPEDMTQAVRWYEAAAARGAMGARTELGELYYLGEHVPRNCRRGAALARGAAVNGPWTWVQRWGMDAYLEGNPRAALVLFLRGADLGYGTAAVNAAWIMREKPAQAEAVLGGGRERVDAVRGALLHLAAEAGQGGAALDLAQLHFSGRAPGGGSPEQAVRLWHAVAQLGNAEAEYNLAVAHLSGLGLPLDLHRAEERLSRALALRGGSWLAVGIASAAIAVARASVAAGGPKSLLGAPLASLHGRLVSALLVGSSRSPVEGVWDVSEAVEEAGWWQGEGGGVVHVPLSLPGALMEAGALIARGLRELPGRLEARVRVALEVVRAIGRVGLALAQGGLGGLRDASTQDLVLTLLALLTVVLAVMLARGVRQANVARGVLHRAVERVLRRMVARDDDHHVPGENGVQLAGPRDEGGHAVDGNGDVLRANGGAEGRGHASEAERDSGSIDEGRGGVAGGAEGSGRVAREEEGRPA